MFNKATLSRIHFNRDTVLTIKGINTMKKCAILTMDTLDDFVAYDQMLDAPLNTLGWDVEHVSWHKHGVDWNQYKAVIIRSTWDYQQDAQGFMRVLEEIENSTALLLNSLKIAKWNINKNYLREVDEKGAKIIPTIWLESFDFDSIEGYFEHFKTEQIIIKPTISANSENTFWLMKSSFNQNKEVLKESLKGRQLMVQPFIPAIIDEGEYSLFYFANNYSHCILKTPKSGDFRVQEEHGGQLQSIQPNLNLIQVAKKALATIPEKVLYARVDLVEFKGEYHLMEIELIEPSLYFNLDEKAAQRFARAFDDWMK